MKSLQIIITSLLCGSLATTSFAEEKPAADGFVALFDGKTLDGWKNPYEWGQSEVVDGEIHLTGDKKFFVTTEIEDDKDASGVIGIQHHGEKGQTYKFRNLRIKELK